MPLAFTSTQAGSTPDYMRYLYGKPKKTSRYNDSDMLDFTLVPIDGDFVKLERGAYITFDTATYPNWFTGYVTSDPELIYLGSQNGAPVHGYKYQATSDDYLLNLNVLGTLPPFAMTYQGDILAYLANYLAPGVFDTSSITGRGQLMARYSIEPNKRFKDVVKEFCDMSSFVFYAQGKVLYFEEQDWTALGYTIDGTDPNFTPSALEMKPSATPVINDALVLGDVEPQHYVTEYFISDGLTGTYPLVQSLYGVDKNVILDDDFSSGAFDSSKWIVTDSSNYLQVYNGYAQCLGGPGLGNPAVMLQGVNGVPLDTFCRLLHGEWDFIDAGATSATAGWICCLITGGTPTLDGTGNMGVQYGIRLIRDGSGVMKAYLWVNGNDVQLLDGTSLDPHYNSFFTIDYTKRYIIRTTMSCTESNSRPQDWTWVDANGLVNATYSLGRNLTAITQTYVVEIDPSTGNTTNTYVATGSIAFSSNTTFSLYFPIVDLDLHCTFTAPTLSVPLQASLATLTRGNSTLNPDNFTAVSTTTEFIGPNEIDAQDGMAPAATITTANIGQETRSSLTGKPQYNYGQSTLTYFKDSTRLINNIPDLGKIIRLSYRSAGSAVGRATAHNLVQQEAAVWGDVGYRTLVKTDIKPRPKNSAECEMIAVSLVGENSFQHYEGSYTVWSDFCTAEPRPGRILAFANLPATMPSVSAEEVMEVETEFVGLRPIERFQHKISFGKGADRYRQLLGKVYEPAGLFTPQTAPQQPNAVDFDVVAFGSGMKYPPDPANAQLFEWNGTDLIFQLGTTPSYGSGAFEVRATNEGWGADDGKNLIGRYTSAGIGLNAYATIPRTSRTKTIWVKTYDYRNHCLYSEDLTNAAWVKSSATVTNVSGYDDEGKLSALSSCAVNAGGSVLQTLTDLTYFPTFTISLKGTAGQSIQLQQRDSSGVVQTKNVTFTGRWQRETLTHGSFLYCDSLSHPQVGFANVGGSAVTFLADKASAETNNDYIETVYCKTNGSVYGLNSRYAACMHVAFPLSGSAPTGVLDYRDPTNIKITVILPANMTDVWGVEIRGGDNTTVLYHSDLTSAGYNPTFIDTGNTTRLMSYYLYTYNLEGTYSAAYNLTGTIPTPTVTSISVDETLQVVHWTATNALSFRVEIANNPSFTGATVINQVATAYSIAGLQFYTLLYIRVTPIDQLGDGTSMTTSHVAVNLTQPMSYSPTAPFSSKTGSANGNEKQFLHFDWGTITAHFSDGTPDLTIPASSSNAVPPSPICTTVAGGSLPARTYYVRNCYMKGYSIYGTGIMGVSTEVTISVGANQLLKVTSPAAVTGYDGWNTMIGTVGNANFPQLHGGVEYLAFGTDYTEPTTGPERTASNSSSYHCWNIATGVTFVNLGSATGPGNQWWFYPCIYLPNGFVHFDGGAHNAPDNAELTAINKTNTIALTAGGLSAWSYPDDPLSPPPSPTTYPACPRKGSRVVPLGKVPALSMEFDNEDWVEIRTDNGYELVATPKHPIYSDKRGKIELQNVEDGEDIITDAGVRKVVHKRIFKEAGVALKVQMTEGHLYFANGILSHNWKILGPSPA